MIQELLPQAERIGAVLKARNETLSIAESSTAGVISAAMLAVPGASAYFIGGAVVYTRVSRTELLRVTEEEMAALKDVTPSTEPYALLFARKIKQHLETNWALGGMSLQQRVERVVAPQTLGVITPRRRRVVQGEERVGHRRSCVQTLALGCAELRRSAPAPKGDARCYRI